MRGEYTRDASEHGQKLIADAIDRLAESLASNSTQEDGSGSDNNQTNQASGVTVNITPVNGCKIWVGGNYGYTKAFSDGEEIFPSSYTVDDTDFPEEVTINFDTLETTVFMSPLLGYNIGEFVINGDIEENRDIYQYVDQMWCANISARDGDTVTVTATPPTPISFVVKCPDEKYPNGYAISGDFTLTYTEPGLAEKTKTFSGSSGIFENLTYGTEYSWTATTGWGTFTPSSGSGTVGEDGVWVDLAFTIDPQYAEG